MIVLGFLFKSRNGNEIYEHPKKHYEHSAKKIEDQDQLPTRYFRESPSLNSHHLHWHDVVGQEMERFGEIFYYMHRQLLVRYEAELLSDGLNMTHTFCIDEWDLPIADGYDPRLGSWWTPRPGGIVMGTVEERSTLKRFYKTLMSEARSGGMYTEGRDKGIDRLGRLVEKTLHNVGHAYLMAMGGNGVMGSAVASLRDPIFYRWHTCLEDIFREYKESLGPYTDQDLNFEGVEVTEVEVNTDGHSSANTLFTFMELDEVKLRNIDGDLDFEYDQDVPLKTIKYQRLNHHHFQYKLSVHSDFDTEGVIRVFLKPYGAEGNKIILEMDHFYTKLKSGPNMIERDEASSPHLSKSGLSLTDLQDKLMNGLLSKDQFDWAGCGWPVSLNVPRGKVGGMVWQLVVMVSSILEREQGRVEEKWESAKDYSWSYCVWC